MDQSHYNAFAEEIRNDIAEVEQQLEELRDLEAHVEKYLNRKLRGGNSRPRKKTNSKQTEEPHMVTVEFGPDGFPQE